jgi:hypothetical protein
MVFERWNKVSKSDIGLLKVATRRNGTLAARQRVYGIAGDLRRV